MPRLALYLRQVPGLSSPRGNAAHLKDPCSPSALVNSSKARGESISRNGSVKGRPSGEIIQEEDEDEEEDEVEVVEEFSPVKPGEIVEITEGR